jgi:hypothetical protein
MRRLKRSIKKFTIYWIGFIKKKLGDILETRYWKKETTSLLMLHQPELQQQA